jgi:hypothetical protein
MPKPPKKGFPYIAKERRRLLACKIIENNDPDYINNHLKDSSVGEDYFKDNNSAKKPEKIKLLWNITKQFQTLYEEMRIDLFGENLSEAAFLSFYTFPGKCCLSTYAEFKDKFDACYLSQTPAPTKYNKAEKIVVDPSCVIQRNTDIKLVHTPFSEYEPKLVYDLRELHQKHTSGPTLYDLRYCLLKILLEASDFKIIETYCTPEYGGKCTKKECLTEGYATGLCVRFYKCLDSGTLKRKKFGLVPEEIFKDLLKSVKNAMDDYNRLINQNNTPTWQDDQLLNPADRYTSGMI